RLDRAMNENGRATLELADWRRRVAAIWDAWRRASAVDAAGATAAFRAAKDELFRTHPQSPLPPDERASFRGLRYWAYDPAWRMTVQLDDGDAAAEAPAGEPAVSPLALSPLATPIALPNSGAQTVAFRRIGSVALGGPLEGERLGVFWIEGYGGGLFLPFRDATSGAETYGAGRYLLDTIKSADHGGDAARGELVLDFNMAFHPSCAYDPRWSCPLAPPENRLFPPARVGERLR
ncbi:MAG: DUF1684 domain-containing protein, partial [Candidatus Limnocylindrales bacterium]